VPVRGSDPATPTSAFCDLFQAELSERPLKNGFAAPQKSFPLRERPDVIMINYKPLMSSLERRKTFDSPLANHFSAVMQRSLLYKRNLPALTGGFKGFSPGPADSACFTYVWKDVHLHNQAESGKVDDFRPQKSI
jgi:hypothetical protein